MGVEKFFSTVSQNFNVIQNFKENNNISYLLFDFNSIIHHTSSKLIEELNQNNFQDKNIKLQDLEIMIIKKVNEFIISILQKINLNELKLMYIALDGVPSFSKMLEQKKRRFVGDFIEKILEPYSLPFSWNKNNISPGTIFMNTITKYLSNIKSIIDKEKIKKEDLILDLDNYDYYKKINIFNYSDTNLRGEAEMKIFDLINNLDNGNIIFYSPDSDVILLSMISKRSDDITVLKFDQQKNILSMININQLKESINIYCKERLVDLYNFDKNKIINDIVYIFTIFGNDFLPKCEAIQTNLDFLFLIDIYLIILIDYGYILINNNISNIVFYKFLLLLKDHEKRLLKRNALQNIYENYKWVSQKNFYIDLLKLKKSQKISDSFYDNIYLYIDPLKISEFFNKKYGCLEFYLIKKNDLLIIIKKALNKILPINSSFNIDINKINEFTKYEKFRKFEYNSNQKKHIIKMKDMNMRRKELYLIENKLDKYTELFVPINSFYNNIITINKINTEFYYNKFFNNLKKKDIVINYLEGFKWVHQYYFDRKHNINEKWYYPYNKAPLIETIINYYSSIILNTIIKSKINNITPIEQLLYITPIRLSEINNPEFYALFAEYKKDEKLINKVKLFIEKNSHFFYNLDEIYNGIKSGTLKYGLFDCSSSNFISKCHYEILNFIVNLDNFVKTFQSINS